MKKNNIFAIIGMIVAWASFYLLSKWGVVYTSSPFVAGMLIRSAAFVVLFVYIVAKGEFSDLFKIKGVWFWLLLIGLLGYLLDTFANIGFQKSSVGTGTILLKLDIFMANIISAFVLKEKLTKGDWLCSLVMIVGVIFVLGVDFTRLSFNIYDLFFILSAMAVTANAFVIKNTQQKFKTKNSVIAFYNNLIVFILFVISAYATRDINNLEGIKMGTTFFVLIAAGGLAQSLIYIFYYYNLERYPVWLVKVFLLFIPIVSTIIGVFAFKEAFTLMKLLGMAFVLLGGLGIILIQKRKIVNLNN